MILDSSFLGLFLFHLCTLGYCGSLEGWNRVSAPLPINEEPDCFLDTFLRGYLAYKLVGGILPWTGAQSSPSERQKNTEKITESQ